jgi:hypothetical protein
MPNERFMAGASSGAVLVAPVVCSLKILDLISRRSNHGR